MGGEYGGVNTGRLLMSFLSTSTYFKFEIKKKLFQIFFCRWIAELSAEFNVRNMF
jgi:hypothetical protein